MVCSHQDNSTGGHSAQSLSGSEPLSFEAAVRFETFSLILNFYSAHCRDGVQTGDGALSGGDWHSDPGGGLDAGDALVISSSS